MENDETTGLFLTIAVTVVVYAMIWAIDTYTSVKSWWKSR